jgi:hypothetical protein
LSGVSQENCFLYFEDTQVPEEIQPYIIYRLTEGQLECALWQISGGPKALALFLSGDAAAVYRQSGQLDDKWHIFRPERPALLELLKACFQAEIRYAVLDPDPQKAKRVFSIEEILTAVGK